MDIVVSHITALRWLVRNANPASGLSRPYRMKRLPQTAPDVHTTSEALRALSLPDNHMHLVVSSRAGRRPSGFALPHVWSANLPAGSVIPLDFPSLGNRLFVSSPEFVFLQLALTYPLSQAAYFGFALCSSYRIDEWTPGGIALRVGNDTQLTTVAKIAAFLDRAGAVKGSARARRALAFVRDNSFSPMESGLALSLGMPLRHGGFNLGDVTMNPTLKIRSSRQGPDRPAFVVRKPDLLIEARGRDGRTRRVAIDYDSSSFHAGETNILRDIERRNEFASLLGITHLSLTSSQVLDFRQYERIAVQIRQTLGKRKDPARKAGEAQVDFEARQADAWHRQFKLWAEVVRSSDFRRLE